jgi:hypothetical protein
MTRFLATTLLCCASAALSTAAPQAGQTRAVPAVRLSDGSPSTARSWRQILAERLPLYGHRNWIVIADSAYPAQSREGIETVVANADQITVVREVLSQLAHTRHVTPIVHVDKELLYLQEEDAEGITAYRDKLHDLLGPATALQVPHEKLIHELDEVSQTFRVLIIKTNMTLPYTSVFLQLDCAYWGPDAEKRLRERMPR